MIATVFLKDVCVFISGGTPKTTESSYWGGNIPWISIKDFVSVNRFVSITEKSITELGLTSSATNLLEPNDIILSARGTVGESALIATPMAFNQSCYGLRSRDASKLLPHYLFYWLRSNKAKLLCGAHGSVFDTITRDSLNQIEMILPNIAEQSHIVDTKC